MFADNIDAFFRLGGHGVAATYTRSGKATQITGIFDRDYFAVDPGGRVPMTSSQPRFTCSSAALPSGAGNGDTLKIGGSAYVVRVVEPDGTGITQLVLEAQ
jgi:hypothetical protein